MEAPIYLKILFYLIIVFVFGFIMASLKQAFVKLDTPLNFAQKQFQNAGMFMMVWLLVIAILAMLGIFSYFDSTPPTPILLIVLSTIAIIVLLANKNTRAILMAIPIHWLIYFQSIRILVEIFLYGMAKEQLIPIEMTFAGMNYDIIPAILAPAIAYFTFQNKKLNARSAIVWNYAGLISILIVISISVSTMPTSFQSIDTSVPNIMISKYPYVWLPTFIVPTAILFHILSLKKLLKGDF